MKIKITSFFYLFFSLLLLGSILLWAQNIDKKNVITIKSKKSLHEILVKFKSEEKIKLFKIKTDMTQAEIVEQINNNFNVDYAEPNYFYQAAIIPSDTFYKNQWYLEKIKAHKAWDIIREAPNKIIAIIDTGVQIDHPDLVDNIWVNIEEVPDNNIDDDNNGYIDDKRGWDFVNGTADPSPKFNDGYTDSGILHGTIVAGIASAGGNNATGVTGVTWQAKLMPLKVLDDSGEGDTFNVIQAIDYAINNQADIINLSFVGTGFSQALNNAIERAYRAGIIIVAAGGNEQDEGQGYSLDESPLYPVCHDGPNGENWVVGVAATDGIDQKASFSGYGKKCIDIAAPGVSIFSTASYYPDFNYENTYFNSYYDGYWSGTSMAAPMVSAALSLIEEINPQYSREQVIDTLFDTSDNINRLNPSYINQLGSGRLNVYNGVKKAQDDLVNYTVRLLVGPYSDNQSLIKLTTDNGESINQFLAYHEDFKGGVRIASGDINGDAEEEIVTGAGLGGGPHVKIFSRSGNLLSQFFAYAPEFRGGVNVAVGDIDGDSIDEIITGAGLGGGPHVRIFNSNGQVKDQFFAYAPEFRGGVNVAVGDIDGDSIDEIITGAGLGGGPQVRMFKYKGKVVGQFFAYAPEFRGGVNVAVGDIDGGARNNSEEIITAPGKGGGPHIRIFDNYSRLKGQFFAYHDKFRGGVNLASGDLDNDGYDEIITGAGPGGTPHLRIFEADGELLKSYFSFSENFAGGVGVSTIKINN